MAASPASTSGNTSALRSARRFRMTSPGDLSGRRLEFASGFDGGSPPAHRRRRALAGAGGTPCCAGLTPFSLDGASSSSEAARLRFRRLGPTVLFGANQPALGGSPTRGCFAGSQSASRRPLSFNSGARFSALPSASLVSEGGSGNRRRKARFGRARHRLAREPGATFKPSRFADDVDGKSVARLEIAILFCGGTSRPAFTPARPGTKFKHRRAPDEQPVLVAAHAVLAQAKEARYRKRAHSVGSCSCSHR